MGYYLIEPKIPDLNGRIQKIEYLTHEAVRRFRLSFPECPNEDLKINIDFVTRMVFCQWLKEKTLAIYPFSDLGIQD